MRITGGTILRQIHDIRATTMINEVTKLFYCMHPTKKMHRLHIDNDLFFPTYKAISAQEGDIHHEIWCSVGVDGISSFSERTVRHTH